MARGSQLAQTMMIYLRVGMIGFPPATQKTNVEKKYKRRESVKKGTAYFQVCQMPLQPPSYDANANF